MSRSPLVPFTIVIVAAIATPWLTSAEAAQRARVGIKTVYRETRAGRLRGARVGGRRELRYLPEWVDQWLESTATPVVVEIPRRRA